MFFGLVFNPLLFEVQKHIFNSGITWNDEYFSEEVSSWSPKYVFEKKLEMMNLLEFV